MRRQWKLLFVVSILLVLTGGGTAAQDRSTPDRIILWSPEGPVAVERAIAASAAVPATPCPSCFAERLLQELLEGPTAQEAQQGLQTTIPHGTALLGVSEQLEETLIVRLDMPTQALQRLDHESFEIMVTQIGDTLIDLDWRDLHIQVKEPEGDAFVALAEFLPPVTVPLKPSASLEDRQVSPPPVRSQAQPSGALSGKTVYVSAGHGWQWVYSYRAGAEQWKTQRPPYPNSPSYQGPIIEDHNNAEAVNQYLLHYLWNAGAAVWTARERDMNPHEVIVDDDASSCPLCFVETGWTRMSGGYGDDHHHETETAVGSPTATAQWSKSVPTDGRYAVYVWYQSGPDKLSDARYTVHHAGGETAVVVDQRSHGYTWDYIGTYGFLASEEARVTLTNLSSVGGKKVVADAVRFGGGTFDDLTDIGTGADVPPDKPWWEVASFYYTQKMGMDAAYGDVTARPIYARWEHAGTGDDAVYISWHTNGATGYQWSYSGTETYAHNGEGLPRTENSLELRHAIHTEVVHDIRAGWDASWVDRGEKQRNLGELRLLWDNEPSRRMPGALIEIGFHDHPDDTDALKEPAFNMLVARAIYQGIAKYFNSDATLLPEPPTHLAVENSGAGSVRVSWQPPATGGPLAGPPSGGEGNVQDLGGDAATGYRVYTSTNGIGWSNGVPVSSGTEAVIDGFSAGEILFVRVTATNAGGESLPTETLAARVGDEAEVLLVNGFDRLNGTMAPVEDDPVEGLNVRVLLDRMNSYNYVIQHGEAIDGYAFDSASNEAVQTDGVDLSDYAVVDWILGEESAPDETLSAAERARLRGFLESGGALFISGTEIGWHLDGQDADPWFYNNMLRADFVGDDADTYRVSPEPGSIFDGLDTFHFDAHLCPSCYDADSPDVMTPINGSSTALVYQGGTGGTAAVQYVSGQNDCKRVVYFGFPFETVVPEHRSVVMSRVLGFLSACLNPTVDTSIDSPTYGAAHASLPAFEGTAHAGDASLSKVEVRIQDSATSEYWDGSHWVTAPTWLDAAGLETWSYVLPASLADGDYRLLARGWTTNGDYDESPAEVVFTYDATPPASTSLITPTGGAVISALPELELVWQAVDPDGGSSLSYIVKLDGVKIPTARSFYTTTTGIIEAPHTWGVQVVDVAGNASDWVTDTFTVEQRHAWLPLMFKRSGDRVSPCHNLVVNGGFETDARWKFNPPTGYPTYVTTRSHSGQRSAMVGHDDAPYSSVRQEITLPEGSSATLRLWLYPISEGNDPDDLHYVWLRDEEWDSHPLELTTSDAREWKQGEYDLTPYMGQKVTVFVGAMNDQDGNTASIFVDDVELEFCP